MFSFKIYTYVMHTSFNSSFGNGLTHYFTLPYITSLKKITRDRLLTRHIHLMFSSKMYSYMMRMNFNSSFGVVSNISLWTYFASIALLQPSEKKTMVITRSVKEEVWVERQCITNAVDCSIRHPQTSINVLFITEKNNRIKCMYIIMHKM